MKTFVYYCVILFCSNSVLFGQSIAFPKDTAEYYKQIRNQTNKLSIKIESAPDSSSLNKIEDNVKKDTVNVYTIKFIEERKKYYIIHVLKDEYHFRIKSIKSNVANSKNSLYIKKGRTYQFDIRDFKNVKKRTFYSTNVKDTEECMPYSSTGEYLCSYNPKSEEQYSQVLNLKGLYLTNERKETKAP